MVTLPADPRVPRSTSASDRKGKYAWLKTVGSAVRSGKVTVPAGVGTHPGITFPLRLTALPIQVRPRPPLSYHRFLLSCWVHLTAGLSRTLPQQSRQLFSYVLSEAGPESAEEPIRGIEYYVERLLQIVVIDQVARDIWAEIALFAQAPNAALPPKTPHAVSYPRSAPPALPPSSEFHPGVISIFALEPRWKKPSHARLSRREK